MYSLHLFKCVIASAEKGDVDYSLVEEYGIILDEYASYLSKEVREFFQKDKLKAQDFNKSFYQTWSRLQNITEFEYRWHQILHYITTYGYQSLGVYDENTIFIAQEKFDLPERLPLKIIRGLPKQEIIDRCLHLLSLSLAHKEETVDAIIGCLLDCDYTFTGKEVIGNREAMVRVADITGVLPRNPDYLFRYFFYKATASSLVIKNEEVYQLIRLSKYQLPEVDTATMVALAGSFNRYKELWLSFKKAHEKNISFVNRLTKLSKKHHIPVKTNILLSLTSQVFSEQEVIRSAEIAPIFQLIRATNALKLYITNVNKVYTIRNGKGWVNMKDVPVKNIDLWQSYLELLITVLKRRIGDKLIYCPRDIDYALPTSEKKFVGNFPNGTRISADVGKQYFLVGIYWEGDGIDLDLRADGYGDSVGWNTAFRKVSEAKTVLIYSGDITSAPRGATEYLYCRGVSQYIVKVNSFRARENQEFKLICGVHPDIMAQKTIFNPNYLILESSMTMCTYEKTLGFLSVDGERQSFYVCDIGTGNLRIGRKNKRNMALLNYFHTYTKNMLRLGDVFRVTHTLEEGAINLHPNNLTKDAIISLVLASQFKGKETSFQNR